MAGFLYFIQTSARAAFLPGEGGELPLHNPTCAASPNASPSGERGFLVFEGNTASQRARFDAARQDWIEWGTVKMNGIDGEVPVWVGIWTDDPPAPEELERDTFLPGYDHEDDDGRVWTLPVLRYTAGDSALPSASFLHSGKGRPLRRLRPLDEIGGRLWEHYMSLEGNRDDPKLMSDEERLRAFIELWKTNYRVDAPELELLEVAVPAHVDAILAACVGVNLYRLLLAQAQKKTAPEESKSNSPECGQTAEAGS